MVRQRLLLILAEDALLSNSVQEVFNKELRVNGWTYIFICMNIKKVFPSKQLNLTGNKHNFKRKCSARKIKTAALMREIKIKNYD